MGCFSGKERRERERGCEWCRREGGMVQTGTYMERRSYVGR